MRGGVGPPCFPKKGIALWPGWKRAGQFASSYGPSGQPIVKGNGLLVTASTLHDTTSLTHGS